MAELSQSPRPGSGEHLRKFWRWLDKAWLAVGLIPLGVLILDAPQFLPVVQTALGAFLGTLPIILFAISAVAYVKACG